MFYSEKKIVGLLGAGFANICFCNPKTKIIEFKTNTTGMNSGNIALKTAEGTATVSYTHLTLPTKRIV